MSYTPTTWTTGDTITASAMNKIENGIANAGGGALIVEWDNGTDALDKTVSELYAAYSAGTPIFIRYIYGSTGTYEGSQRLCPVVHLYNYSYANNIRIVAIFSSPASITGKTYTFTPSAVIFSAASISDYPVWYCTVMPSQSSSQ